MYQIQVENFDIEKICYSGQCFRMKKNIRDHFEVVAFGLYLEIAQKENELTLSCTQKEYEQIWKPYLGLSDDYSMVAKVVGDNDPYMKKAMEYGYGIRILKQDPWEMIISFIISQQNNIPRIRTCIQTICEKYGDEKVNQYGEHYYTFPTAKVLAACDDRELRSCNLGYRSPYIIRSANMIVEKQLDLAYVETLEYEAAKTEVLKLFGVGIKVAECICLYGLHHLNAFPVDTHINHVLNQNYPDGFPFEKYAGIIGIVQQYAFYYDLYHKG